MDRTEPVGSRPTFARWRDFAPAFALLVVGVCGLAAAYLVPSGKGGQYAVVAPPWYSVGQKVALIRNAQGQIADINPASGVIIATSDDPGFTRKLYQAGAWLVLDPLRLRGCDSNSISNGKDQA